MLIFSLGWIATTVISSIFIIQFTGNHFRIYWISSLTIFIFLWLFLLIGISEFLERMSRSQFLFILTGLCLSLRIFWLAGIDNQLVSDFASYHELAVALVKNRRYAIMGPAGIQDLQVYLDPNVPLPYITAFRPPGTALWGALLYFLFGIHPLVFKIANLFLGAGVSFLIFILVENSPVSRLARKSAILWAFYPPSIMATNLFGSELLYTFLLLLTACLFMKIDRLHPPTITIALSGICSGLAILTRSTLAIVMISAGIVFFYRGGRKKGFLQLAIFLFFLTLTLTPWVVRNWKAMNAFIPVCTLEGSFLGRHSRYLVPESVRASANWRKTYDDWKSLKSETGKSRQSHRIFLGNVVEGIKGGTAHMFRRLHNGIKTTFSTDLDVLYWSTLMQFSPEDPAGAIHVVSGRNLLVLSSLTTAFYTIIIVSSLAGLLNKKTGQLLTQRGIAFLGLLFLFHFIAFALLHGQDRYHFSVIPLLLIFAAQSLAQIQNALQRIIQR